MSTLTEKNLERWNNCHVPADKGPSFEKVANRIRVNQSAYKEIEIETGVPWWFIGITHYRESNLRMNTQLAQGDPLNEVSTHVPKGRGPFSSFKAGAIDALVNCSPHAANNRDWSLGGALTMFEKYNGLGYANKGLPSPYVWAGTDQYEKGKYVADGVFDPEAVDQQLGCAGLMKFLGLSKTNSVPTPKPKPKPPSKEIITGTAGGAAAGGAAAAAHLPWDLIAFVAFTAVLAVAAYFIIKKRRERQQDEAPVIPLPKADAPVTVTVNKTFTVTKE